MPEEVRIWRVEASDALRELKRSSLDLEKRLEDWLAQDISILDPGLLVIGRQVATSYGGIIDLLCLDGGGDVVVVELKRDKTPREITAQVLDYGSWAEDLSHDDLVTLADAHLGPGRLQEAFTRQFDAELPETLNAGHRLLVVGSRIDPSSERIIRYLSQTHGVNINAATFNFFRDANGEEYLARVFLLEAEQGEGGSKGGGKRRDNLSYEALERMSEDQGVGDLYRHAVASIEPYLLKKTTQSSIGFIGNLDGSRRTILSLIPEGSSSEQGLRFQVYLLRLQAWLGLEAATVADVLPTSRKPWSYGPPGDPNYEGFEGFIASRDEIDRLAAALGQRKQA